MKVVVVAEFYPRRDDPVLGIWAHRQALAARDAGAELHVLVLHRLVPPRAAWSQGPADAARSLGGLLGQPHREDRDGLPVTYVRYASPPRARAYASWGAWAAPVLALALRRLRHRFPFDAIHAHNAVPAGDAVRRAGLDVPLLVSVHGGDVLYTAPRVPGGREAVAHGLRAARLVLANSHGIAELARDAGAGETRVVHLGADLPAAAASRSDDTATMTGAIPRSDGTATMTVAASPPPGGATPRAGTGAARVAAPAIVTVGHLVARKRHADVLRALAVLAPRHPTLRYVIIGDGPERIPLEGLAARLGISERVELRGQLAPAAALECMRRCTLFAMPSTEEAFGVAYIEAMAAGLPAIGCRGEPGPEEIAAAGDGFLLVPPGDIERLTQRIEELLDDPQRLREASRRARQTVAEQFTWERCGAQTAAAYADAIESSHPRPRADIPAAPTR